ncbi:TPA: hypothetical protein QHX37_002600 [Morganella morganii subsp. morganii]|nr:hypothetical protein [Morganella morganii subsp. morganii]
MSIDFITLAVAIIAGAISIVGLVITKENKISEFRQKWIDDLRSTLIKLNNDLFILQQMHVDDESKDNIASQKAVVNKSITEVYLRVNKLSPNEHEIKLIETIENIKSIFNDAPKADVYFAFEALLIESSSSVLKHEWIRVKKGELTYQFWKTIFTLLLLITISSVVIKTFYDFISNNI